MIRKSDDLVGSLIHDVAHLIRHRIDSRMRPYRLTRQKWLALGLIQTHPDMTQAELAGRLELGAAATGRLVDRMVNRGFVRRSSDARDRRAYRLRITSKAAELLEELHVQGDEIREEVLQGLDAETMRTVEEALKRIKRNLAGAPKAPLATLLPLAGLLTMRQGPDLGGLLNALC